MKKLYYFIMLHINYRLWQGAMKTGKVLWANAMYYREEFRKILQKQYEEKHGKISDAELNELKEMRKEQKAKENKK